MALAQQLSDDPAGEGVRALLELRVAPPCELFCDRSSSSRELDAVHPRLGPLRRARPRSSRSMHASAATDTQVAASRTTCSFSAPPSVDWMAKRTTSKATATSSVP